VETPAARFMASRARAGIVWPKRSDGDAIDDRQGVSPFENVSESEKRDEKCRDNQVGEERSVANESHSHFWLISCSVLDARRAR